MQALAENISYTYAGGLRRHPSWAVAFRLFDGAGTASAPAQVAIVIQDSPPAPTLTLDDLSGSLTVDEAVARFGVTRRWGAGE